MLTDVAAAAGADARDENTMAAERMDAVILRTLLFFAYLIVCLLCDVKALTQDNNTL